MIVYGRNAVHEALRGSRRVREIWATSHALRESWLQHAGVPTKVHTIAEIELHASSEDHQGVCADVSEFTYADADDLLTQSDAFLIALDQVQDPQNLGSICRTAECAGASGVIIPERRSASVTAAVCKASAGAVEHLPIAQVRNLADFLGEAKSRGAWCYGAAAGGTMDYREVDFSGPMVLVMGSEGSGLRPRVAGTCDALISLPIHGRIESLSVANAAAVLLYAAAAGREH